MKIDSHHHIWDLSVREQGWMVGDALNPIRQNFLISDLRAAIAGTDIKKTVLVQTVTNYDETPELLALAEAEDVIVGVVGFLKIDAEDALSHLDKYENLPGAKYLVGIRDIAHDYPDPNYLSKPTVIKNIVELGKRGYTYDLLTKVPQLRSGIDLVKSAPNVQFVMDHISKPFIAEGVIEPWASMMRELATLPNVVCKVSGMVTEAKWDSWKIEDFAPYVEILLEAFTPSRLMFGTDWPVALLAASYREVVTLAQALTSNLSPTESDQFWRGTAVRAYGHTLNEIKEIS